MSWKAGIKRLDNDSEDALIERAHALRLAKDNSLSRIRYYRELQAEGREEQNMEKYREKNWQRERYWEKEKAKTEDYIQQKSSAALLRDVLSCNLQVSDLLGEECEAKWKELSCVPAGLEPSEEPAAVIQARTYIAPSSMVANQFLLQTLTVTDPLLLDTMMQAPFSDQQPAGSSAQPLISPRAKLLSRIQSTSSVPGTPMVVRSGPQPITKRLIDSVFLAGPKKSDILDLLSGQSSDLTPTSIYPVAVGRSNSTEKKPADPPPPSKGRPSSLRLSGDGALSGGNVSGYGLTPEIQYLTSEDPDIVTDILPSFCFPNGVETTVTDLFAGKIPPSALGNTMPRLDGQNTVESIKPKYFVFQLTGNDHTQFGVCMRFSRRFGDKIPFSPIVYTSYCICLVTSNPLFLFLFDVLAAFLNTDGLDFSEPITGGDDGMLVPPNLKHLDEFAHKLLRQTVPHYGRKLLYNVTVKGQSEEVILQRRMKHELSVSVLDGDDGIGAVESNYHTLEWALPMLLAHVPLKEILFVLGCMLTEMKVVIKCKDIGVLSACVMGLLSLMRPLSWSCPYIVILPESLRDYLDSPVPLIVGVVTTPINESADYLAATPGVVVIDVNMKKVNLDPADVVYSHTLKLPHTDTLLPKLKPFAEVIASIARSRRRNNGGPAKEPGGKFVQLNSPPASSPVHSKRSSTPPVIVPTLQLSALNLEQVSSPTSAKRKSLGERDRSTSIGSTGSPRLDSPRGRRRASAGLSTGGAAAQHFMRRYSTDSLDQNQDAGQKPGSPRRKTINNLQSPKGSSSGEMSVKRTVSLVSDLSVDDANERNKEPEQIDLSSAVMGFSNCLAAHMTQIADTAIKLSWDNKAVRRQARHDLRNAPRERTSSDASIDSSNVSLSVNEDTLPSLQSSRMTFRKVGNAMLSFIKKFKETQIFCHYCQLEKEKQLALEMKQNETDNGSLANSPRFDPSASPDVGDIGSDGADVDMGREGKPTAPNSPMPDGSDKRGRELSAVDTKETLEDPVASLFTIMIHGSLPYPEKDLSYLASAAEKLYASMNEEDRIATPLPQTPLFAQVISGESYRNASENNNIHQSSPIARVSPAVHPSSWNPFASPPPPRAHGGIIPPAGLKVEEKGPLKTKQNSSDEQSTASGASISTVYNPYYDVKEDTLFCNGRCGGKVDTPMCTEICCQVWQAKAEEVQRMMEARQILLDMQSHNSVASTRVETRTGKVIKIPPLPSMKQLRETNSQFEMRLKLIHKQGVKSDVEPTSKSVHRSAFLRAAPPGDPSSGAGSRVNKLKKRPLDPSPRCDELKPTEPKNKVSRSQGNDEKSTFKTVSVSSRAIARYYKSVERRRELKKMTNAIDVICRHIYAYVQSKRLSQLMHSIISVQAVVRGFFVRCNFVLLSELLRQRNFMYKVARRKFKKWLRATVASRQLRVTEKVKQSPMSALSDTASEADSKPSTNTALSRSMSPVASRFADITNAVANALGGGNIRKSPKAELPLVPRPPTLQTEAEAMLMSPNDHDPFDQRTSPRTIIGSNSSLHSSSTLTGEDAARFKVLREHVSSVSDTSEKSKTAEDDSNLSAKARFQKINHLTVATGPGPDAAFQGLSSSLLGSKSLSVSTPSEAGGRRSPSNMSQYSTASVSSVMDDVLKMKQRMSTGSSRSRGATPRVAVAIAEEDTQHPTSTISDMLTKVAISPKSGSQRLSYKNSLKETDGDLKNYQRQGSIEDPAEEPNVSYHYFEHVDIDEQIDALQNDLNQHDSGENNWSTDALGSDSNSAFRKQSYKKASPLTRHSTQAAKVAGIGMTSIPEGDGDNESTPSMTPRDPPSPRPSPPNSRRKPIGENSTISELKDGSPTGSGRRVSSQMKSLQDTLEEVLKSELDSRKQWEEIGSSSSGPASVKPIARAASVTNTVSAKTKTLKKTARKRNSVPGPIKLESLTSITEAPSRLEMGRGSDESEVNAKKPSGHHRISSDVSVQSALSDESSGYHASASPLPQAVADALGSAQVKEMLTIQQQRSIRTLYDLLRRGINVMKHGRSGRPKLRRLFCDETLSTLFWREVDAHANGRKSIDSSASAALAIASSAGDDENGIHERSAAEEETKAPKRRRSSFLRFGNKDDSERLIKIQEILEVTDDLSAEVMQRSISRQPYSLGPHQDVATCVISLVLRNRERTYDFEVDEKSWNVLFHSLRILVNYHQIENAGAVGTDM